MIILLHNYSCN